MSELVKAEVWQKYTPEEIAEALEASSGMISPAARALGCSRNTIKRYIKAYPEIQQTIEDAREATTDLAENRLEDAIRRGEAWAICFYLKTQAKGRGYVERAEIGHTGQVNIKLVYDE